MQASKYGTFGKHREYQLIKAKESFEAAVQYQFKLKEKYILGSQIHGNITCYEPLFEYEDSCEKLEFNECKPDKYRCTNGMCITEQYFLDGRPFFITLLDLDKVRVRATSFTGSIKCVGYQGHVPVDNITEINPTNLVLVLNHIETSFCNHNGITPNFTGPQYDRNCWLNRLYRCANSQRCISMYRIRDGFVGCPQGDDETTINCPAFTQKYRFRCEQACLFARMLGNLNDDCPLSNYDEFDYVSNIKLSYNLCREDDLDACNTVRKYIERAQISFLNTSTNTLSLQPNKPGYIKFDQYCDTFGFVLKSLGQLILIPSKKLIEKFVTKATENNFFAKRFGHSESEFE
ncbi:unnamed protein product [Didymodactylos carnosus]|uniref:Uncharacterized protein n=1 Tax=Didymodactylos carnosus TaxID=1234261 RepID=A0A814VGV2_9BILA|nr:unnamed protein product [Didymodactylos carnosus]CAF3954945.1 unnamed protein product [Didymodactylos carnosus]